MEIRMPIKSYGNYVVAIRQNKEETRERCQQLRVRRLSPEEQQKAYRDQGLSEEAMPTHQIIFYDFGCKRIIEGKLAENEEDRTVFQVQDKEYVFFPFVPKRP
ncbi:hypothetical protein LZ24_02085 [Desulfobotulus alkaliphilus]|uniref:Uncharacterized protein n=1 Tax=Desulfobotulus alkaliphilus TaxID=622671 RepID=A0A562RPV7_9BACT|nr:hypothetical protein [Desulfobotulus alkaliphilus]TWI71121.1 hypothetical protein LZ24_02085 [Desulfobotulus alkaliphilus]